MKEFAFDFDDEDFVTGKDLVLKISNTGDQQHFLGMAKIPEGSDLQQLLMSDEEPEGFEEIGYTNTFNPGDKADVGIKTRLTAGRYIFFCFISDEDDPEGTPHAFKGMISDFTVK